MNDHIESERIKLPKRRRFKKSTLLWLVPVFSTMVGIISDVPFKYCNAVSVGAMIVWAVVATSSQRRCPQCDTVLIRDGETPDGKTCPACNAKYTDPERDSFAM